MGDAVGIVEGREWGLAEIERGHAEQDEEYDEDGE